MGRALASYLQERTGRSCRSFSLGMTFDPDGLKSHDSYDNYDSYDGYNYCCMMKSAW